MPLSVSSIRYRRPYADNVVIAYCVISPVINGFGAAFFVLSALVYKYLFIWVYDQPPESDTGGMFFPKAITHVFVGIYIQEVCMCALFFLARNSDGKVSAIPQGALMVVLLVLTVSQARDSKSCAKL